MKGSLLKLAIILSCTLVSLKAQSDPISKPIKLIAFGSCHRASSTTDIWQMIAAQEPDIWVWAGDIIYGDSPKYTTLSKKYKQLRQLKSYQNLLQKATVVGIWDDHDYGKNNGGIEFPGKVASQRALLEFLEEPAHSPRWSQKGIYTSYTFGQGNELVKIILLDGRFNRQPPGANADPLGEIQWRWLEKQLKHSQARVHVIVSGIQVLASGHRFEKWANFPAAKQRLLDLLAKHRVSTPIFISGDRHLAEITCTKLNYSQKELCDITSSGLTHSYTGKPNEPNPNRVGQQFTDINVGFIRFNWKHKPALIEIGIWNQKGLEVLRHEITL